MLLFFLFLSYLAPFNRKPYFYKGRDEYTMEAQILAVRR